VTLTSLQGQVRTLFIGCHVRLSIHLGMHTSGARTGTQQCRLPASRSFQVAADSLYM
jgi:hypothetical protein